MVKIVVARYNEDIHWLIPITQHCIIYNKGPDDLKYIPNHDKIVVKCQNLGREGGTYVKHIIDNYTQLDDYTIFIQANPVDHIYNNDNNKSYKLIYNTLIEPKNYKFKYISQWLVPVKENEIIDYCSGIASLPLDIIPAINSSVVINYINSINSNYNELLHELNNYSTIKLFELTKLIERNRIEEPLRTKLFLLFDYSKIRSIINNNYRYGSGALFIVSKAQILKHSKEYWNQVYLSLQEISPASGYGLEKMWNYLLNL